MNSTVSACHARLSLGITQSGGEGGCLKVPTKCGPVTCANTSLNRVGHQSQWASQVQKALLAGTVSKQSVRACVGWLNKGQQGTTLWALKD